MIYPYENRFKISFDYFNHLQQTKLFRKKRICGFLFLLNLAYMVYINVRSYPILLRDTLQVFQLRSPI